MKYLPCCMKYNTCRIFVKYAAWGLSSRLKTCNIVVYRIKKA